MHSIRFETNSKGRVFCFVGSLLIGQARHPPRSNSCAGCRSISQVRRRLSGDSWMVFFNPGAFTMRDYYLSVPDKEAAISALKRAAGAYL